MVNDEKPASRTRARRLTLADVGRLLSSWLVSSFTLLLADAVQPNLSVSSPWTLVWVAAVQRGRRSPPALRCSWRSPSRLGWLAVLPIALFGQAAVMYVAMQIVPGITATFWAAFVTSWICAAVGTLVAYVATAGTDDGLTSALARRVRPATLDDPEVDGVVFVQLDGVPFPVLRWAVQAGWGAHDPPLAGLGGLPPAPSGRRSCRAPRRPASSGSCTAPSTGRPGLPVVRPGAGPGAGRQPAGRRPDHRGAGEQRARSAVRRRRLDLEPVLRRRPPVAADDEPRRRQPRGAADAAGVGLVPATPTGFARSFNRTLAEIVKERWQARQQERHRLDPRVHRGWTFALLRAVTNALLRDLNTALVAEEMLRGTKVHLRRLRRLRRDRPPRRDVPARVAGRPRGLDRVLGQLERLAELAPRRYRIVVLSDHGQSQGRPFADRYGEELSAVCAGPDGRGGPRLRAVGRGLGPGRLAGRGHRARGTVGTTGSTRGPPRQPGESARGRGEAEGRRSRPTSSSSGRATSGWSTSRAVRG